MRTYRLTYLRSLILRMLIHGLEASSHLAVDTPMLVCLLLQHAQPSQRFLQALAHGVHLVLQPGVLGPGDHHTHTQRLEDLVLLSSFIHKFH